MNTDEGWGIVSELEHIALMARNCNYMTPIIMEKAGKDPNRDMRVDGPQHSRIRSLATFAKAGSSSTFPIRRQYNDNRQIIGCRCEV
ncbi:hypothetical protein PM082_003193 [Marasmius tenuissimus]|nr:hypothetical protein PM082_003193 [Marasmius tenuissimus]